MTATVYTAVIRVDRDRSRRRFGAKVELRPEGRSDLSRTGLGEGASESVAIRRAVDEAFARLKAAGPVRKAGT